LAGVNRGAGTGSGARGLRVAVAREIPVSRAAARVETEITVSSR
jgi:hypothetical protein